MQVQKAEYDSDTDGGYKLVATAPISRGKIIEGVFGHLVKYSAKVQVLNG